MAGHRAVVQRSSYLHNILRRRWADAAWPKETSIGLTIARQNIVR
jgi:hypothetical protein